MIKHSRETIRAAKARWKMVTEVQDKFVSKYIHDKVTVSEVVKLTHLSDTTVRRFFHRGDHVGKKNKSITPYSIFHGPNASTVFGIATALGMRIDFVDIKPNGRDK